MRRSVLTCNEGRPRNIQFVANGSDLHISAEDESAGDTAIGFGAIVSVTLEEAEAIRLRDWLDRMYPHGDEKPEQG